MYINGDNDKPYYMKIIWMEMLLTFTFSTLFLLIKTKFTSKDSDEVIKGIGLAFVFAATLGISAGSGGCLNPALAFA